jgi:hypothetical protein
MEHAASSADTGCMLACPFWEAVKFQCVYSPDLALLKKIISTETYSLILILSLACFLQVGGLLVGLRSPSAREQSYTVA